MAIDIVSAFWFASTLLIFNLIFKFIQLAGLLLLNKYTDLPMYGRSYFSPIYNTGVQSINNVYAIVNKVENVLINTYIFDLIDNGVYVVYTLYSRIHLKLQN